jgi:hypothetical protein
VPVARDQRDAGTLFGQRARDGRTDAARGTGHERVVSGERLGGRAILWRTRQDGASRAKIF